jgi:hypothetical protein
MPFDEAAAAAILFPGFDSAAPAAATPATPPPAVAAPAPGTPGPEKTVAEVMFPGFKPDAAKPAPETPAAKPAETKPDTAKPADDGAPPVFDGPAEDIALAAPVAKELGLSHVQFQKLVALRDQLAEQEIDRNAAAWETETRATFQPYEIKQAQSTFGRFASPAFIKLLHNTGIGNHPELIRFARNVARGHR